MSSWSDLGLPLPEISGYGYAVGVGLKRTPFAAAAPRQDRTWANARRTFTLMALVDTAQLRTATEFLERVGFKEFSIDLLSGAFEDELVDQSYVRLIKDYSISAAGFDLFKLQMEVEGPLKQSIYVTTTMYPIEVFEEAGVAAPGVFLDAASPDQVERIGVTTPPPFTGTYVQTVFWHYILVDTSEERIDHEETAVTVPAPFTGTYVQTVFHAYIEALEHHDSWVTVEAPIPFTGTYEQTVFHLYVESLEHHDSWVSVTAPAPFTGTLEPV